MERKNVEIPAQDLARQRDFEERIREMFSARVNGRIARAATIRPSRMITAPSCNGEFG